jgi:hypothetical protein
MGDIKERASTVDFSPTEKPLKPSSLVGGFTKKHCVRPLSRCITLLPFFVRSRKMGPLAGMGCSIKRRREQIPASAWHRGQTK